MRVRRYLDNSTPKSSEIGRKSSSIQRLQHYYYNDEPHNQHPLYANYPSFQTLTNERRPTNPYAEEMSRMIHTIKIKNVELARQENLITRLYAALEERNHALAKFQLPGKGLPNIGKIPSKNRAELDATMKRPLSQSRNKVKRNAISGESSRYLLPNKANVPQSFEKSARTKDMIKCAILANDFMKHLDPRQISEIIESMCPVRYPTASFIIKEGEVGSVVYVLAG
ncbi:cGMP-dependent protein kinase 1 [Cichlidogyrus casuarinus]|uniref:cGMP-dependent protein kinase 1 n=1 Tax=Cichlidogyrus casuarinus TaxID=1844966 RepID=A0ABD2Q5V8_9PLAT